MYYIHRNKEIKFKVYQNVIRTPATEEGEIISDEYRNGKRKE